MPWHKKAMKDVISCDKLLREAHILRPVDFRMGQPSRCNDLLSDRKQTRGTETSHYPEEKKVKTIPLVAASEKGIA